MQVVLYFVQIWQRVSRINESPMFKKHKGKSREVRILMKLVSIVRKLSPSAVRHALKLLLASHQKHFVNSTTNYASHKRTNDRYPKIVIKRREYSGSVNDGTEASRRVSHLTHTRTGGQSPWRD